MSKRFGISRRKVLAGTLAAGAGVPPLLYDMLNARGDITDDVFGDPTQWRVFWTYDVDGPWLGPQFWANPMQDWSVRDGRAECLNASPNRQLHLLTKRIKAGAQGFNLGIIITRAEGKPWADGKGSAGFRIGIRGPLGDYRNDVIFGKGLDLGITSDGGIFIGNPAEAKAGTFEVKGVTRVALMVVAEKSGEGYDLRLQAYGFDDDVLDLRATVEKKGIAENQIAGGIALISNFGGETKRPAKTQASPAAPRAGLGKFRFEDWAGWQDAFEDHPQREFGPILFTQYTLSAAVLKLTAQMAPVGPNDTQEVELAIGDRSWKAAIHPEARTATFRVDGWKADADAPYVVRYAVARKPSDQPAPKPAEYHGTIRREPVDKPTLTVADISCNIHAAFPNAQYVEHVKKLDPDLIAFTGDQFYESTGGFGVTVDPLDMAVLDYLRKWYMHGWTWRDLTRDRPSISIPDDHDVYQGNIWGESGAPQSKTQEAGGYRMPAPWVNVVHRTQTSHHPDPYDATPVKQGIAQYFGRMIYAGVDFAILADRMYKSAPEGNVPPTGGRGDHVTDPKFDPRTADLPDLQLLGAAQEKFLTEWADDWKGVLLKAVVSQTIFSAMATTHGGSRDVLRADYDTNGWPQTARNRAVALLRKAKAFHIAGDQHLPAVVQYGIDQPRDAVYAFAGPAVNVGYPRWWEPTEPGQNREPGASERTGDFRDHFGNWMTVVAFANGAVTPRAAVLEQMADKASGLGIVTFEKQARKITIDCWPYLTDPSAPDAKQFPGWPVTIDVPS